MVSQSLTTLFIFFTTFLFIFTLITAANPRPNSPKANDLDFIRTSCNATLYPDVCFRSLSGYASAVKDNPARLAKLAIRVSLSQTKSLWSYLSKLTRSDPKYTGGRSAVYVCFENIDMAVDEMKDSLQQLRDMNGRGGGGVAAAPSSAERFGYQMSNVQTWMSAAFTDEDTCTEAFEDEEGAIKTAVCGRIEELKRLTSNALALVNTYANISGVP